MWPVIYVEFGQYVLIYHTSDSDFEIKGTLGIQIISLIERNLF